VSERQHLTREEAAEVMRQIMDGKATSAQIAALLIGLKMKGEQTEELVGFVEVMREKSIRVHIDDPDAIDLCGTGGDGRGTFNVSTVASFVVAGAGVTVAKHGNRSVSSRCGSADVLKALGIKIEIDVPTAERCINELGIGFLFAPAFHPAMKHASQPRAELGTKTCFNLLGPMTNPAGVRRQLVGAFSRSAAGKIADVLDRLGALSVYVVSAHDGLDEISLHTPTSVIEVRESRPQKLYDIDAATFHLGATPTEKILGGDAERNAVITMEILNGSRIPHREYVIANAAFGLLASSKTKSIDEGVHLAQESIDSGKARRKLHQLVELTNR
ncbi:MAG TPA: anthranilate phosphoribosyltransferase, partial [Bacteroidota bacterium]|nr:anthranilate phosphoribosyltransferase [Bacteroidota bacterium]